MVFPSPPVPLSCRCRRSRTFCSVPVPSEASQTLPRTSGLSRLARLFPLPRLSVLSVRSVAVFAMRMVVVISHGMLRRVVLMRMRMRMLVECLLLRRDSSSSIQQRAV